MRVMYDAVSPSAIPANAKMVAGYLAPNRYAWSAQDWARFPNAVRVEIAVFASTNAGHVLDVEIGDATPAQAPGWVLKRRAAGVDPTIYCNLSTWPAVQAAFKAAGVREPHYWIAHYGAGANIPAGAVAVQYADPAGHSGGNYDISAVADYWPGVDHGGYVTDPVDTNILGFIALGGTSTRVNNPAQLAAGGVDATSLFGRVCTIEWALNALVAKVATLHDLSVADVTAAVAAEMAKTVTVDVKITEPPA